jgi:hypothetical protein
MRRMLAGAGAAIVLALGTPLPGQAQQAPAPLERFVAQVMRHWESGDASALARLVARGWPHHHRAGERRRGIGTGVARRRRAQKPFRGSGDAGDRAGAHHRVRRRTPARIRRARLGVPLSRPHRQPAIDDLRGNGLGGGRMAHPGDPTPALNDGLTVIVQSPTISAPPSQEAGRFVGPHPAPRGS